MRIILLYTIMACSLLAACQNTNGLIIQADKLAQLAQNFSGKRLGLMYGRRLQKEEGHGHRLTLILVVYGGAQTSTGSTARMTTTDTASATTTDANEYYDLGEMGALVSLCPPPRLCDLE